ncbi:hypothetical protein ACLOJK_015026 [Asimina triloba]
MQSSGGGSSVPQPEVILEWLHKELGYRPQGGPYISSTKSLPSVESLRKICRGNMLPVWNFLLQRVKSEKTVEKIRRNILVHGSSSGDVVVSTASEDGRVKGRRKDRGKAKLGFEKGLVSPPEDSVESRENALRERDAAQREVERLRHVVRRQRKDLRTKMLEVSREEAERKRKLDEKSNYRHKQATLEAYDQQCDEAAKIFSEYQKRLHYYVNQARDAQRSTVATAVVAVDDFHAVSEKAVYSTVKGSRSSDDVILIETTRERNIRKACEILAAHMLEKICNSFPAYEGNSIHLSPQLEAAKLGIDFDGEIPEDVKAVAINALKNPPLLLQAITSYTLRMKTLVHKETEKIDIRADAELLRYKYENNRVTDVASPDISSNLPYHVYGNGKIGMHASTKGTHDQLLERQFQQHIPSVWGQNQHDLISRSSAYSIKLAPLFSSFYQNDGFEVFPLSAQFDRSGAGCSWGFAQQKLILLIRRVSSRNGLMSCWPQLDDPPIRMVHLESMHAAATVAATWGPCWIPAIHSDLIP